MDGGGGWHVNISGQHVKDGRYALWQAACGWGLWIHAEGAGNTFGQHEDTGTEHVAMRDVWMGRGAAMGALRPCQCQWAGGVVVVGNKGAWGPWVRRHRRSGVMGVDQQKVACGAICEYIW